MTVEARVANVEVAFKKFRIPHARLLEVHRRIDVAREVARKSRELWLHDVGKGIRHKRPAQKFIPIIGPSGSGKSTCIDDYVETRLPQRHSDHDPRPLVYVELSAEANTRRLGSDICFAFGDPDFEDGSAAKLLRRGMNHLQVAEAEVLVIDEIQHLIHKDSTARTAWSVTETFKRMLNQGICPMFLVGTPEARPVLLSNPQMKQRCLEPIFLDPLDIRCPADALAFMDHCAGIDDAMVEHGIFKRPSMLVAGDLPACFHEISKGVIGTVSNTVMMAAMHAIQTGAKHVRRSDLSHVVRSYLMPLQMVTRDPFEHGPRQLEAIEVAA